MNCLKWRIIFLSIVSRLAYFGLNEDRKGSWLNKVCSLFVFTELFFFVFTVQAVFSLSFSDIIEGLINFKSGKERPSKFVFESVKFNSKKDKVKLYGKNEMFSNNNKSFCLKGSLKNNKMIGESLRYKYSVKVLDESKLVEGKVTTLTEKLNSSTENK